MRRRANGSWYAAKLRLDWSPERQAQADAAEIRIYRVEQSEQPAEVTVELPAVTGVHATTAILDAFPGIGPDAFEQAPYSTGALRRGA
ncbi:MAG TPA: hypothetical protein VGF04_08205 [Solirubrobacterales bacterium]